MSCPNCGQEVPPIGQGQFCPFCGAALSASPGGTLQAGAGQNFHCAWENRDKLGFVASLSQTWTESVMRPSAFFKHMPRTGGIGAPLVYAVLFGTIGGLFSLFWEYLLFDKLSQWPQWPADMPFAMSRGLLVAVLPFIPFAIVISLLLMSLIYHVCLLITGSAKSGWEATFRVIAYASSPAVFLFVPVCGGFIAAVWSWILQIIGWREAHESTTGRVVLAALLPLFLCCGLGLMIVAMFANFLRKLPLPTALAGPLIEALWR